MLFIDVYKADEKIATSGATSLSDLDLHGTYRAMDSVATGSIHSLFCGDIILHKITMVYASPTLT